MKARRAAASPFKTGISRENGVPFSAGKGR